MSHAGNCRTAAATPGLLITHKEYGIWNIDILYLRVKDNLYMCRNAISNEMLLFTLKLLFCVAVAHSTLVQKISEQVKIPAHSI